MAQTGFLVPIKGLREDMTETRPARWSAVTALTEQASWLEFKLKPVEKGRERKGFTELSPDLHKNTGVCMHACVQTRKHTHTPHHTHITYTHTLKTHASTCFDSGYLICL